MLERVAQYSLVYPSPVGCLGVTLDDGHVVSIDFISDARELVAVGAVAERVCQQLDAYFSKTARNFDVPLRLVGSEFAQHVWGAMLAIPFGEVATYGDIAKRLNSSPRAVGGACRTNPVPIIVPCHRIVATGGLGGYSGETTGPVVDTKKWLLGHEGALRI